jgi:hypothetical protein
LKIHHALKETSYLTDGNSIAGSGRIATSIGNYLLAARRGQIRDQNDFTTVVYTANQGEHDAAPCGETEIPQASQPAENKIMGDKSPKSNQKKSSQKQSKASSASQKKSAAAAAKSAAGKKK